MRVGQTRGAVEGLRVALAAPSSYALCLAQALHREGSASISRPTVLVERTLHKRSSSLDNLPDELLIRILSLLVSSRHLYSCSLVTKRWAHLVRLVSHFGLEASSVEDHEWEQGLISWFGSGNLRCLSVSGVSQQRHSSLGWLQLIGKSLHSLTITVGVDGFWPGVLACHQLRCLHVHVGLNQLGPLETTTPAAAPPLPNLVYCFIRTGLDVDTTQRLLDLCPSLVHFQLFNVMLGSATSCLLKSPSLHCLVINAQRVPRRRAVANFSLALDMPNLRWMLLTTVPRVELLPSTCNVEWIKLGEMRSIQGLDMSRLNKLTLTNTFRDAADVLEGLAPFVSQRWSISGVKQLDLALESNDFQPRSLNLVQLLEPFQSLKLLSIARITIKYLSLEEWNSRQAPLRIHIDTSYSHKRVPTWESNEIDFVRKLLVSGSCVTLLKVMGVVCTDEPPEFRPEVPPAIMELGTKFLGRVQVHPLRFNIPPHCNIVWRYMKPKFSEPPYSTIKHQCISLDENNEVCAGASPAS